MHASTSAGVTPYFSHSRLYYGQVVRLLLLASAIFIPTAYVRTAETTIAYIDICAPIFFLLIFIHRGFRLPRILALYMLYIVVAFASVVLSPLSSDHFRGLLLVARLLFIVTPAWVILVLHGLDNAFLLRLLKFVAIGAWVGVVIGLVLYFLGIEMREEQQRLWLGHGLGSTLRAGGLVGNSGEYGQIAATSFLAASAYLLLKGVRPSVAYYVMLLSVSSAIIVSSSRGSLLMMVVFSLVFVLLKRPNYFVLVLPGIAAFALLAVGVGQIDLANQDPAIAATLRRLDMFNLSGEGRFLDTVRFSTWSDASAMFHSLPAIGYGYKMINDYIGTFVDNAFLLAFLETGWLGGGAFILFWVTVLTVFVRRWFSTHSTAAALGIAITLAFISRLMGSGANASWSVAPLLFLIIGVLLILSKRCGYRLSNVSGRQSVL